MESHSGFKHDSYMEMSGSIGLTLRLQCVTKSDDVMMEKSGCGDVMMNRMRPTSNMCRAG
jgi:hypothetical protein